MSTSSSTWQAWNELQTAVMAGRMARLRALQAQIDTALQRGQCYFDAQDWTSLQGELRKVAPAVAGRQLLQQLEVAEVFMRRFEGDEVQNAATEDFSVDEQLERIRAAIAAAKLCSEPALAVFVV